MSKLFQVRVSRLPQWLDWRRLLGEAQWTISSDEAEHQVAHAMMDRDAAADLAARLRGVGIGGSLLNLEISPPLNRKDLRNAYTEEARRYRDGSKGFSRSATQLDHEGRISLTPEALAVALGERVSGLRVIDTCAGAGGNAIGFARAGCSVLAIEINPDRLGMARHNAKIYGVADRIEFVVGDARRIVPEREADLLFIDPPWGERYNKERVALVDLPPCGEILAIARHLPKRWLKVPPSFDPTSLPGCKVEAFFGTGRGDSQRVKFLLVEG